MAVSREKNGHCLIWLGEIKAGIDTMVWLVKEYAEQFSQSQQHNSNN
jgi:hypothetical protein